MDLRERIVVKLLVFLIKFIGRKVDKFYSYELENAINELIYPKLDLDDLKKELERGE